MTDGVLSHALEYAKRGWRVIPCKGKIPLTENGSHDGTTDEATIKQWFAKWPNANVAIVCGLESGLCVLDIDPRNGGDATLDALIEKHGPLPDTASQLSGGGGTHYLFRWPRTGRVQKQGRGIDIIGQNKYFLAEPSSHPVTKKVYEWEASSSPLEGQEIAELPAWLLEPVAPAPTAASEPEQYVAPTTITHLRSALNFIQADERETWIAVGHALKTLGAVGRELWITWSQSSEKWNPKDARLWDGFTPQNTSYEAIFKRAQLAGWINPASSAAAVPGASIDSDTPPRLLRVVSVGDLTGANVRQPQFVVEPIIPRGVVTMLNAPGGYGKTTLALAIQAHVAVGRDFGPFSVKQGQTLFVSLEDEAEQIRFQLSKIVAAFELDNVDVDRGFKIVDGAIDDISLAHEVGAHGARELVADAALAQLAELANGTSLIVIDGVGDALRGNTNDTAIVRDFIRRKLGRIARIADCGILLIGHVDKAGARYGTNSQTYLGSVEFNNSARSRLALTESDGALRLVHEKTNRSRMAEPLELIMSDGVLMPGAARNDLARALTERTDMEALHAAITAANAIGASIPTARTGPNTAQAALETMAEFPHGMKGAKGRARFWAALNGLQREGRVSSETYTNEHRHRRTRWVAK